MDCKVLIIVLKRAQDLYPFFLHNSLQNLHMHHTPELALPTSCYGAESALTNCAFYGVKYSSLQHWIIYSSVNLSMACLRLLMFFLGYSKCHGYLVVQHIDIWLPGTWSPYIGAPPVSLLLRWFLVKCSFRWLNAQWRTVTHIPQIILPLTSGRDYSGLFLS